MDLIKIKNIVLGFVLENQKKEHKMVKTITIYKFWTDWYNFGMIPQNNYIKVDNLRQSSDNKALQPAKKLNSNYNYKIKER